MTARDELREVADGLERQARVESDFMNLRTTLNRRAAALRTLADRLDAEFAVLEEIEHAPGFSQKGELALLRMLDADLDTTTPTRREGT